MFWLFGNKKRVNELEEKTKSGFDSVKRDISATGKWIKHLDAQDKQLFDLLSDLKNDLSSLKDELDGFKEAFEMGEQARENKQVFGEEL